MEIGILINKTDPLYLPGRSVFYLTTHSTHFIYGYMAVI